MKSNKSIETKQEFFPSVSAIEGEILIKGKTLGRWSSKKFILDPEQRMFALRRKNPKKKLKLFDLRQCQVENHEKKKDKIQFDLQPVQSTQKKITLGGTDEKFIVQILNTLISCCFKPPEITANGIRQSMVKRGTIVEKQVEQQDKQDGHNSEEDEFYPKTYLPDIFNNNDIINHLQDNYQNDLFDIEREDSDIKIWKHKKQLNLRKSQLLIQNSQIPLQLIFHLINDVENVKKWNPFVASKTQLLRKIPDEKSDLIYEERQFTNLFPFPREFVYLRHSFMNNDRIIIVDKSADAVDVPVKLVRGFIRFSLWKISKSEDKIKIITVQDSTLSGLSYPKEDVYFLTQYLLQLKNLSQFINQEFEQLMKNEELQINPFLDKSHSPVNKKQQDQEENKKQENPDNDEEFYDCDDNNDEINNRLRIESKRCFEQEVGDQIQEQEQEEQLSPSPNDDFQWTKWKMILQTSGENNNFHIKNKYNFDAGKNQEKRDLLKLPGDQNFLFRNDWARDEVKGGLRMINVDKINAQKKVVKFLLKRIGANLLSGKSLISISLPVDIFETRSSTERLCNAMNSAPLYLEKALIYKEPIMKMKESFGFALGFLIGFLSMEKPFNPILGETYQGWIDKCPIYAEQVSHHPPITALIFYGRGYKIQAQLELVAHIHSNSATGKNVGPLEIKFPDQTIQIILSPGVVTGTAFGDRMFLFTGKTYLLDVENQIGLEVVNQPEKKYCQNLGIKYQPFNDFLCGGIFKISEQTIAKFKREGYKKFTGFERQDYKDLIHRIEGRWTKEVYIDQQCILNVDTHVPCQLEHESFPLASDANYRMDLLWWKLRDFENAQKTKEQMEVLQRNDRKLREIYQKNIKH